MIGIETSRSSGLELSKNMTHILGDLCGSALPIAIGHHELDGRVTLPFQRPNFRTLTEPQ